MEEEANPKKRKNVAELEEQNPKKNLSYIALNKSSHELESQELTYFALKLHDLEIDAKTYIDQYFIEVKSNNVSEERCIRIMEKIYFNNIEILNLFLYHGEVNRYRLRTITHNKLFDEICSSFEILLNSCEKNKLDRETYSIGNYGMFLFRTCKFDLTEKILNRELLLIKEKYGKNHEKTFKHILLLAKTYERNKKYAESKTHYECALDEYPSFYHSNQGIIRDIKKSLYKVTEKMLVTQIETNSTI
jgi:hypothetical protein